MAKKTAGITPGNCDEIKTECALQLNDLNHEVQNLSEKLDEFKADFSQKIYDTLIKRIEAAEKRIDTIELQLEKLVRKLLVIIGGATVCFFLLQFFAPVIIKLITG